MDGLALLCNLFADGPVTLRRLRAANVHSLGELERVAPATLGSWLHASVAQACTFAEEARKLARRLAEQEIELPPAAARAPARQAEPGLPFRSAGATQLGAALTPGAGDRERASPMILRPGLFPGLDEATCARLQAQQVRTLQSLIEFAGLALARDTGIPYSTLLELARRARRLAAPAKTHDAAAERAARTDARAAYESVPAVPAALAALRAPEPIRTDEFTLPMLEPESSGPFV